MGARTNYLKIDGFPGNSTVTGRSNWIEFDAWTVSSRTLQGTSTKPNSAHMITDGILNLIFNTPNSTTHRLVAVYASGERTISSCQLEVIDTAQGTQTKAQFIDCSLATYITHFKYFSIMFDFASAKFTFGNPVIPSLAPKHRTLVNELLHSKMK